MSYEIKLLEMTDQPTLVMRSIMPVGKLPEFFGKAYGGIISYLTEIGDYPAGMPFAAYHNLDMNAMDVEAGFPVARNLEGKGDIRSSLIPGGKFLSTLHIGSYDSLKPAYDAWHNGLSIITLVPTGVAYEYYLNDPSADPSISPETEVRFPLK